MDIDTHDDLETKAGIPHDVVVTHGAMTRAFEAFKEANDQRIAGLEKRAEVLMRAGRARPSTRRRRVLPALRRRGRAASAGDEGAVRGRTVLKCVASYIISYEGVKDCSDEAVAIFVEHVGKVATYAQLRSLYAQLDWASKLGTEPLPILQLQPKI